MEDKRTESNRRLNFNSLAIGFLLALCLILAFGASGSNSKGPGKYQCCAAGNDSLAVFVIDTQTGQSWRLGKADTYDFGTPQSRRSAQQSVTPTAR